MQLHALRVDETYSIISGKGQMDVGGKEIGLVEKGYIVHIPKAVSQRIQNIGDSDLVFLCACTPRFHPQSYTNLE